MAMVVAPVFRGRRDADDGAGSGVIRRSWHVNRSRGIHRDRRIYRRRSIHGGRRIDPYRRRRRVVVRAAMVAVVSMALIAVFITKYAITADSAETSFSFFAIPMATPTAKIKGRLSNTALPTLFMITSSAWRSVPSPSSFVRP